MTKPRERHRAAQDVIEEVLLGASRIQALYVAVRLGLPDLLVDGPGSSTLLASSAGVHPGALHRLLRFLVAEGFFALTDDGRFALTPQAEPLTTRSGSGMREYVIGTATRGWDVWGSLLHSVETGQPAFERVFGQSYFAEQHANAESLSRFDSALAPAAAETGKALSRLLAPADCVADLGCGSGALLVELLLAWPTSRGVAFDSEVVLALARARFSRPKLAGRIQCVAGDFFELVPAGASLYVLSLVLHDWEDDKSLRVLRNCQSAMAPGARLAIVEQVLPDNPRDSPSAAYADLGMLVNTGGRERTLAEYRSMVERAGLRFDGARPLRPGRPLMVIEASRGLM